MDVVQLDSLAKALADWGEKRNDPLLSEHTLLQLREGRGRAWRGQGWVLTLVPDTSGQSGLVQSAGPGEPSDTARMELLDAARGWGFARLEVLTRGEKDPGFDDMTDVGSVMRMSRSLTAVDPSVEGPTFRSHDVDDLVELLNRAFDEDHPENGSWDCEDLERRFGLDWFDPDGLLVAEIDGSMAGICWTKIHPDGVGEIYLLAVDPRHAGAGLGRALAGRGLGYLSANAPAGEAVVYTQGENVAARRLYESLGFHVERIDRRFSMEL